MIRMPSLKTHSKIGSKLAAEKSQAIPNPGSLSRQVHNIARGQTAVTDASSNLLSKTADMMSEKSISDSSFAAVAMADDDTASSTPSISSATTVTDAVHDANIGLALRPNASYQDPDDTVQLKQIDRLAQEKLRQVDGIDEMFLALALTDALNLAGPAIASVLAVAAQRAVEAGANGAREEAGELQELVAELKEQRHSTKSSIQAITRELESSELDMNKIRTLTNGILDIDDDDSESTLSGASDLPTSREKLPPMKRLMGQTQKALNNDNLQPAEKEQIMQAIATAVSEYEQAEDGKNIKRTEAFFMKNFGAPAMGLMSMGMFLLAGTAASRLVSDSNGQEISEANQIANPGNTLGDITGAFKTASTGVFGTANAAMTVFALSKIVTGAANRLQLGRQMTQIAQMDGISNKSKDLLKDSTSFAIEKNNWDGPAYGIPTAIGQALFTYSALLEFVKSIPTPPGTNLLATLLQTPAIPAAPLTLGPAIMRARQETREGKREGNADKVTEGTITEGRDLFHSIQREVLKELNDPQSSKPIGADNSNTELPVNGKVLASKLKKKWEVGFLQANSDIAKTKTLSLMHHAVTKEPKQQDKRIAEADRLIGHKTFSTSNLGVKKRFMSLGLKADKIPISIHPSQQTTVRNEVQKDMKKIYGDGDTTQDIGNSLRGLLEGDTATKVYRDIATELGVNSATEMLEHLKTFENDGYDPLGKLGQSLALNVLNSKSSSGSSETLRDNTRQSWQKLTSIAEKSYDTGNSPEERIEQFKRATEELSHSSGKRNVRSTIDLAKRGVRGLRSQIPGLAPQQPMSNPLLSRSRLDPSIRMQANEIASSLSDNDLTTLFSADNKAGLRQQMNEKAADAIDNSVGPAETMRVNAENLLAQHHLMDMVAIVYKRVSDPTQRMAEMEKLVNGKGSLMPDLVAKIARQDLPAHFLRNAKNQFSNDKAAFSNLFDKLGEGEFLFEKQKMALTLGYSKPVVAPDSQSTPSTQQNKTLTQAKAETEMLRLLNEVYDSVDDPDARLDRLDELVHKPSVLTPITSSKRLLNSDLGKELKALFTRDKGQYEGLFSIDKGRNGNNQQTRNFALGLNQFVREAGYLVSEKNQPIVDPAQVTSENSRAAEPNGVFSHRQGESKQQFVFDLDHYTSIMEDDSSLEEAFWRDSTRLLIKAEKNEAKVISSTHEKALSYIDDFDRNYKKISKTAQQEQVAAQGANAPDQTARSVTT